MHAPFAAYEGDGPYVFVCYAHEDAELVYSELEFLRDAGVSIWYDEGIAPGSEWSDSLARHIEGCAAFLYFVTRRSVERPHCRREVNFALGQNCLIVVVHLEPTELPAALRLSLSDRQAILKHELSQEQYARKLVQSLEIRATSAPLNSGSTQNRKVKGSRRQAWNAALVLVASGIAIGALAWLSGVLSSGDTPAEEIMIAVAPVDAPKGNTELQATAGVIRRELMNHLSKSPADWKISVTQRWEIADLGVSAVLRLAPPGIRLDTQLLRVADDSLLWSKSVAEPTGTGGDTWSDRAEYLSNMLGLAAFVDRELQSQTSSQEAASLHVKGVLEFFEIAQGTGGNVDAAIAFLRRASELDPRLLPPIQQLGIFYSGRLNLRLSHKDAVDPAHFYARRVLELEPDATFVLAVINAGIDLDYEAALANLEHAGRHGWHLGEVQSEKGKIYLQQGKLSEAIRLLNSADRLGAGANRVLVPYLTARAHMAAGDYAKAIYHSDRAVKASRGAGVIHPASLRDNIVISYLGKDWEKARHTLEFAWEQYESDRPEIFPGVFALLEHDDEARELLEQLEVRYARGRLPIYSEIFWAYFWLDDQDAAFVWLHRAIENREWWLLPMLRRSEVLADLRDDARYAEILKALAEIEQAGTPTGSVAHPAT